MVISEIRRRILEENPNSSWYRICEGGIYTTTDAYIDTKFNKNYQNAYLNTWIDCKLLEYPIGTQNVALWGSQSNANKVYNLIVFTHMTHPRNPYIYAGVRHNYVRYTVNFVNNKPYLNKKIRFTQPKNQNNYYCSIQFYNGKILGEKIYSNGEKIEYGNRSTTLSPYLFWTNMPQNNPNAHANNIVIYETELQYREQTEYHMTACQLTQNIPADLAWDNKPHQKGEYGMYDSISDKFFGNANSTGYFIENFD